MFVGLLCVFCDNYIYIIKFSLLNFVNFFFKNILLWIFGISCVISVLFMSGIGDNLGVGVGGKY